MKTLVIADVPPRKSIPNWLAAEKIDVIITAGDLEYTQINTLEQVTSIPKIGVYGNHCTVGYMEILGILNLHLTTMAKPPS